MKPLVILLFVFSCLVAFSQSAATIGDDASQPSSKEKRKRHVINIGPMPLWLPIKYEFIPSGHHGVGLHTKIFPNFFNLPSGVNFQPFYRFYFAGKAPKGGFIQIKAAYGYYKNNNNFISTKETCTEEAINDYRCTSVITNFHSLGGGMAGGYQMLIGKRKRGSIDFFGGFSLHIPLNVTDKVGDSVTSEFNLGEFSFLDMGMRFGVAF